VIHAAAGLIHAQPEKLSGNSSTDRPSVCAAAGRRRREKNSAEPEWKCNRRGAGRSLSASAADFRPQLAAADPEVGLRGVL